MKTFKVEFDMDFDDKFTDDQIEEWLNYSLGRYGGCTRSELTDDYDLAAKCVTITKI